MRFAVGLGKSDPEKRLEEYGIDRREFLKYCSLVAVALGLGPTAAPKIAKALTEPQGKKPVVVYLHNAECTGCTEALIRTTDPYLDALIFDAISLEYQETVMAAAGHQAEDALHAAINNPDGFIAIIEGAIPTKDGGIYGKVGNRTMLDINAEVVKKATAVISYGTCAAFGGIQSAKPNPTGAKGILDCFKGQKGFEGVENRIVNIPGCPPNPINLVASIVYYLTHNGTFPELDGLNRPIPFFGKSVHEQCERRHHFQASEFAPSFDSEEARKGWCLYYLGCKGPQTYNNCPAMKFNGTNWPVQAGHPCIGCSEPDFWDHMAPFYE